MPKNWNFSSFDVIILHFMPKDGTTVFFQNFHFIKIKKSAKDGRIGFYETPVWLHHDMYRTTSVSAHAYY